MRHTVLTVTLTVLVWLVATCQLTTRHDTTEQAARSTTTKIRKQRAIDCQAKRSDGRCQHNHLRCCCCHSATITATQVIMAHNNYNVTNNNTQTTVVLPPIYGPSIDWPDEPLDIPYAWHVPAWKDYNNKLRQLDWLVPELRAEVDKAAPKPDDMDDDAICNRKRLAEEFHTIFYAGRQFYNFLQIMQMVERFAAAWNFDVTREAFSIRCTFSKPTKKPRVKKNTTQQRATSPKLLIQCPFELRVCPMVKKRSHEFVHYSRQIVRVTHVMAMHTCGPKNIKFRRGAPKCVADADDNDGSNVDDKCVSSVEKRSSPKAEKKSSPKVDKCSHSMEQSVGPWTDYCDPSPPKFVPTVDPGSPRTELQGVRSAIDINYDMAYIIFQQAYRAAGDCQDRLLHVVGPLVNLRHTFQKDTLPTHPLDLVAISNYLESQLVRKKQRPAECFSSESSSPGPLAVFADAAQPENMANERAITIDHDMALAIFHEAYQAARDRQDYLIHVIGTLVNLRNRFKKGEAPVQPLDLPAITKYLERHLEKKRPVEYLLDTYGRGKRAKHSSK